MDSPWVHISQQQADDNKEVDTTLSGGKPIDWIRRLVKRWGIVGESNVNFP